MLPENLIFDLDGTLWDTREIVAEGFNVQLRKEGLDHLCTDPVTMGTHFGKVMTEIADNIFASVPLPERYALLDRCVATENRYLYENKRYIGYPNVKQTLETLAKNHRLFIVSNSQRGYPELCMDNLDIAGCIEGHLCFGDTGASKDVTIRQLMEKHGITDAVYIGDTEGDHQAAKKAGIGFIWAAYGFGTPSGFDAKIDKIEDLLDM